MEQLAARITALSTTEIDRTGFAYILGQAAAPIDSSVAGAALSKLMELLQHPWNVVARCAMYGIINAGAHATDSLCTLLEEFTVQLAQLEFTTLPTSTQDAIEPSRLLDMITLVSHALGESSQEPTERVVKALTTALQSTYTHLNDRIQRVVNAQHCAHAGPVRTGVNAGHSNGQIADRWLSLAVRAASAVMDALGLVGERVVAVAQRYGCVRTVDGAAVSSQFSVDTQSRLVGQICDSVLPISLRADPALQIPGNLLSHDNSRFWLAEAAAYCVLRLVSSGAAHVQTNSMQVVAPTCPAHHSDQRYGPALCLAAVGRLRELISTTDTVPIAVMDLLPRLARAEKGWISLAGIASADNPEPWLPGGIHGVEWQSP